MSLPTGGSGGGPKKARIEIIPLIDVIFFLLATFVLFTLSLNKIRSVPADLPQASASKPERSDDPPVVLQISEAGSAYWNKEPVTVAEIAPRLAEYKASSGDPRVLVTGDDRADFGAVVRALDEVRKSGIAKVSLETAYRATGR